MPLIVIIDAIVVVILVGVAMRRGMEAALPFFVFFVTVLPLECRITIPGFFDVSAQRVSLIVLAILFFKTRKKTEKIKTLPFKRLIVLHAFWALASTLTSIVMITSVKQLLAQVLEYYFLYYIIVKSISDIRTIRKIVYAMTAAMALCSILGLLEIYAHWSVLSLFPADLQLPYLAGGALYSEKFDRGIRARATFVHPIHFGGALAMVIPLAFYLVTKPGKGWTKKVFLNVSLLLMFWGLYKSNSRGPWLAAIFAMAILTVAADSRIRKRIMTVAALACAVLIIRPGVAETLVNMYEQTFDPTSVMGASFEYRPVLFETVRKTLDESPYRALLGFGLGSFREKGLVLKMPRFAAHRWYTCDSSWILFWYETGYVGALILSTLLLQPAVLTLRSFRNLPRADRYFSLVLLSSLAAFYVVMISVAIYGWGQNGHMLWTVIALSTAYTILKKDEQRRAALAKAQNSQIDHQPSVCMPSWAKTPENVELGWAEPRHSTFTGARGQLRGS